MSNPAEISEMMANAKKQIELKKAELGIVTQDDRQASMAALRQKIAASRAAIGLGLEQQQHQQQQGAAAPTAAAPVSLLTLQEQIKLKQQSIQEREKSLNLIIDADGRTIDKRTGELIQMMSRAPTLKANMKVQKRDHRSSASGGSGHVTDLFASGTASTMSGMSSVYSNGMRSFLAPAANDFKAPAPAAEQATEASDKFFDARLKQKTSVRNKRKLAFNEKGKYEDLANKLRTKSKLLLLQKEIATISKKTGISSDSRLALIQPKRVTKENIPNIEWWDYAVLNEMNYDCLNKLDDEQLKERLKTNRLIEHPVQIKAPTMSDKRVIPTVMLTTKERKKLRRQNRAEALKENQEKIRLGLMPPPEPKVKISNLMRVLGTEAVQDPTKVEEYVRTQMAKRQKTHEEQNASRKLTDAERSAKKKRKITENTAFGVNVAVYRVTDLSDPAVKFKLEANCNQLHMTGIVILCKGLNVVCVEGGPKQQKKFQRLMLNRIKWNELHSKKSAEAASSEAGGSTVKEKNQCALVWEGSVKARNFGAIIFKMCPTITFARDYFKKFSCEHYWDIAQTDAILKAADF